MRYKRVIALLGDLHVGSRTALFPPSFTTTEGNVLAGNAGQGRLYEHWKRYWRVADMLGADTVILDGDTLHGLNRAELGAGLMTSSLDDQIDAAVQLLRPYVRRRGFHVLSGSAYHESLDTKIHSRIAAALNGRFHHDVFNARIANTPYTMHVRHGVGSLGSVYRATGMDKEALFLLTASAALKLPKFHIIAKAHLHFAATLNIGYQWVIQIPCWEAFAPSRISLRLYGRSQPDIGGSFLVVDKNDHISVHHELMADAVHVHDAVGRV